MPDPDDSPTAIRYRRRSDDGADEAKGSEGQRESRPSGGMSRRRKRLSIVLSAIVGLAIVVLAIVYWLHARRFETTDDAFIDGHTSQVSPRVAGQIVELLVHDNEPVRQGQLLAVIDPRDFQVRLAQATGAAAQAAAQLALRHAGVGQAAAQVDVARADAFQAERDYARYRAIDRRAISTQQFDQATAAAKSARARLTAAEKSLDSARADEKAGAASLEQARADVRNAELQLSYTRLLAPIDGHVTRRTLEIGNVVQPGVPVMAIVSTSLWVTANYKETQLEHMRRGQPVRIRVDTFPGVDFSGHVDSFQHGSGQVFSSLPAENATGNYVKVVQRVPVKIVFDDPEHTGDYPLYPGLSVVPRVEVR